MSLFDIDKAPSIVNSDCLSLSRQRLKASRSKILNQLIIFFVDMFASFFVPHNCVCPEIHINTSQGILMFSIQAISETSTHSKSQTSTTATPQKTSLPSSKISKMINPPGSPITAQRVSSQSSDATTSKPPFLKMLAIILNMYFIRGKKISEITASLSNIQDLFTGLEFFTAEYIVLVLGRNVPPSSLEARQYMRQRNEVFTTIFKMHRYRYDAYYIQDYLQLAGSVVSLTLIGETISHHDRWDAVPW